MCLLVIKTFEKSISMKGKKKLKIVGTKKYYPHLKRIKFKNRSITSPGDAVAHENTRIIEDYYFMYKNSRDTIKHLYFLQTIMPNADYILRT